MTNAQINACRENPLPPPPGYCSACLHQQRCLELMKNKWNRMFSLAAPAQTRPFYVVIIIKK